MNLVILQGSRAHVQVSGYQRFHRLLQPARIFNTLDLNGFRLVSRKGGLANPYEYCPASCVCKSGDVNQDVSPSLIFFVCAFRQNLAFSLELKASILDGGRVRD